jgi:hypothetical protein
VREGWRMRRMRVAIEQGRKWWALDRGWKCLRSRRPFEDDGGF